MYIYIYIYISFVGFVVGVLFRLLFWLLFFLSTKRNHNMEIIATPRFEQIRPAQIHARARRPPCN